MTQLKRTSEARHRADRLISWLELAPELPRAISARYNTTNHQQPQNRAQRCLPQQRLPRESNKEECNRPVENQPPLFSETVEFKPVLFSKAPSRPCDQSEHAGPKGLPHDRRCGAATRKLPDGCCNQENCGDPGKNRVKQLVQAAALPALAVLRFAGAVLIEAGFSATGSSGEKR